MARLNARNGVRRSYLKFRFRILILNFDFGFWILPQPIYPRPFYPDTFTPEDFSRGTYTRAICALLICPTRFYPTKFTPSGFTLTNLTQQKTIKMHPENILHQTDDTQWEVRTPKGDLLACITFDEESGNYYVSEGLDLETEFFGSRLAAFHYAMTGAEL
jgi:hypothetical protein